MSTANKCDGAERLERFARLNKNFTNIDIPKDDVPVGLDLYIFWCLLAEAQRQERPSIGFRSRYHLLQHLGLRDRPEDYRALDHALKWMQRQEWIFPETWRVPENVIEDQFLDANDLEDLWDVQEKYKVGVREAHRIIERHNRKLQYRTRTYRILLGVRSHLRDHEDGRLVVAFDPKFIRANAPKAYFVKVYLEQMRQLRYAHRMLLALQIAKRHVTSPLVMGSRKLAKRIGLYDANNSRWAYRLDEAVEAIEAATGQLLEVHETSRGSIRISRRAA